MPDSPLSQCREAEPVDVSVSYRLRLPIAAVLQLIPDQPAPISEDDDGWMEALEKAVVNNLPDLLRYVNDDPDVEVWG